MPLRSVEAATRDDAIAAAHEQFGLSARVIGVRRVRSGGMLGFFATERYVAEVDTESDPRVPPRERRAAPDPVREGARERTGRPTDGAAARGGVPARNAAAAWAAEARVPPSRPVAVEDRVDELAGLLTASPGPVPHAPAAYGPRSASRPPRTPGPVTRPAGVPAPPARPAWSELLVGTGPAPAAPAAPPTDPVPAADPVGPSPFTAALARMVAGDRDVHQAVEDALSGPADERAPDTPAARPPRPGPTSTAESSVPSAWAHQEEEPVELQDWTTSSPPVVEIPAAWLPAPERVQPVAPLASREESIAEVLRTALAQGRSDEALAGMLRTVMDGASPAVALAGTPTPFAVDPGLPEPVVRETAVDEVPAVVPAPAAQELPEAPQPVTAVEPPAVEPPAFEPPVLAPPVVELPAFEPPVLEPPVLWPPVLEPPVVAPVAADLDRDEPVSSSLWAETVVPATRPSPAAVAPVAEPVVEPVAEPVMEPVAEAPVTEAPVAEVLAEEHAVDEPAESSAVFSAAVPTVLARTASDPAPLSLDTSVMPPLSLLPPLPSRSRGGRPPVPPSAHRAPAAVARAATEPPTSIAPPAPHRSESLATVTRLPLAPVAGPAPAAGAPEPVEAPAPGVQPSVVATAVLPTVAAPRAPHARAEQLPPPTPTPAAEPVRRPAGLPQDGVLDRLVSLGLAEELLDDAFTADLVERGTYSALTRLLTARLPGTPEVPAGAGDVLVVVGPGVETLRAARALAASLRLDPDRVQWATRGDLAGLAPAGSRMTTVESAIDRRHEAVGSGTLTIVAVDAPLRADTHWTAQMLAIWSPVAVWALVEATRKPEDLRPWLAGLPRADALVVQDTDLSADPAAVLDRVAVPLGLPVAVVDGSRATPHRWASLLCERLETPQA